MVKKIWIDWNRTQTISNAIRQICEFDSSVTEIEISAPLNAITYPNVCASLAALFQMYSDKYVFRYKFFDSSYLAHTHLQYPMDAMEYLATSEMKYCLDKVWHFQLPEEINALVTAFVDVFRESDVMGEGSLQALEWCLNEVLDNVLQHSITGNGYIMGQIHKTNKRISICIVDTGIGIYKSLVETVYAPRTPIDAITKALEEKVTRDERIGQGNGLWGLSEIIKMNGGSLRIVSNGSEFRLDNGVVSTQDKYFDEKFTDRNLTIVDFQLDYSKSIDITKALNRDIGVYDAWLEEHENNEGELHFCVIDESAGTGTRIAAEKFRTKIENAIFNDGRKVVIDFDGVIVISSSYADELIGKLVEKLGLIRFMNEFKLVNLSSLNIGVLNRSVGQRLGHIYYNSSATEEF